MIQKIFSLGFVLFAIKFVSAQCTPDASLQVDGISPRFLPHAQVGKPYSQTITVRLFKDTTAKLGTAIIPVTIDSMLLIDIKGMPPGFTYQCLSSNCRFLPKINTCVQISGTSSIADSFPIKIVVRTYGKSSGFSLPPQTDTIRQFSIVVDWDLSTSHIAQNPLSIYPNPVADWCSLPYAPQLGLPKVTDLLGKNQSIPYEIRGNDLILHTNKLSAGTYFITYGSQTAKIIKN